MSAEASDPALRSRNRANARKSTGPRSAAGKARSAQNARRHGATARPADALRRRWLAIILGRPEPVAAGPDPEDPALARALALATAEARWVQAEAALRAFEAGRAEPTWALTADLELRDTLRGLAQVARASVDPDLLEFAMRELAACEARITEETRPDGPRHRLLRRYAREARAERNRGFGAWCAVSLP